MKEALYRRHPGAHPVGGPGQWTCVEEWQQIDFLAIEAWRRARRIGYEVKVSRGDMRTELLKPDKRAAAVGMCTQFYFAVPRGLLRPEEIEFEQPPWGAGDFTRVDCPGVPMFGPEAPGARGRARRAAARQLTIADVEVRRLYGGRCLKPGRGQRFSVRVPIPVMLELPSWFKRNDWQTDAMWQERVENELRCATREQGEAYVPCPTCKGRGYVKRSRVEEEAPTLWVPPDCGLVEVSGAGCRVLREAPRREPRALSQKELADLVRWVSWRPDPRHRRSRGGDREAVLAEEG